MRVGYTRAAASAAWWTSFKGTPRSVATRRHASSSGATFSVPSGARAIFTSTGPYSVSTVRTSRGRTSRSHVVHLRPIVEVSRLWL